MSFPDTNHSNGRSDLVLADLAAPVSHYAHAVRVGLLLFVSGMVAADHDGRIVSPGDVQGQARKVFENLAVALTTAGATFKDVVKVTVYLRRATDREAINPIRQEFFGSVRPASTLVEVAGLYDDAALVEIDAIAVVGSGSGIEVDP